MNTSPCRFSRRVCLLGLVMLTSTVVLAFDEVAPPPKDPTKVKVPDTFANRIGGERENALKKGGGTKESEQAVAKGLLWLALHQAADGHWSLDEFPKHARTKLDDREYYDDRATGKGAKNDTAG